MRHVKRTAISLKPKQAYVDWANGLDDDDVKIGTPFTPDESIYLIDDSVDQPDDLQRLLAAYHKAIFEKELGALRRIEADWPERRDLTTFLAWFDVEVPSLVLDLVGGGLRTERYDRYSRTLSGRAALKSWCRAFRTGTPTIAPSLGELLSR